jgi:nitroreductase
MSIARQTDHAVDPQFVERWSPRAFTGEALDDATLWKLFEAARWAPSASNIQPWRFIYGRKGTPAFATLLEGLVPFNQTWAANASVLIAVLSAKQNVPAGKTEPQANPWHSFDAGAAWGQLALQAHLLGLHTHGMGGFVGDKLRASLGVPDDFAIEAVVAVGRLGDKAQLPEALQAREVPSSRRPVAESVAEGKFGFAG